MATKKVIQIATIGYNMSSSEYACSSEQLVVLTEDGEIYLRDLGKKGSGWEQLRPPTPNVNIDGPAHADQETLY